MTNSKVFFERKKVKGNFIIEIYKYDISESKDAFFEHYQKMQERNFKNERSEDKMIDGYLYVTYMKNILAGAPKVNQTLKHNNRKGRV